MQRKNFAFCFALITCLLSQQPIAKAESFLEKIDFSTGGRIKIDGIYNTQSVSGSSLSRNDLAFTPASIPVTGNPNDSYDLNFRESRLWATLRFPVNEQELSAYGEIDFSPIDRTNSGVARLSNKPRIRHAYLAYDQFTAGKTYTTFLNVSAYPELNDANGPLGILNVRQELLRFSKKLDWATFHMSLEEPDSRLTASNGTTVAPDDSDLVPDIVARLDFTGNFGNWSVATLVREIRSDGVLSSNMEDSKWGGAISLAGRIYLDSRDNIRFSAEYGNVLGRYLSFNTFNDAVMDNNGQLNLIEIFGAYISYQHWWTTTLRSSITTGYAKANHDLSVVPDSVNEHFYSLHLNLIWNPLLNLSIGAEWIHGYRKLENNTDGDLDRMQLTFIYNF